MVGPNRLEVQSDEDFYLVRKKEYIMNRLRLISSRPTFMLDDLDELEANKRKHYPIDLQYMRDDQRLDSLDQGTTEAGDLIAME